jgi:tRNA threonylcarbamoyladenosine biosynthesis protein TsaB
MSEAILLLGIDTSGMEGSLALACIDSEGAVNLRLQAMLAGRRYTAELIPTLREMLAETGAVLADLSALVIVNGPGSFTGLRIGISAAKALAEAAALPVIALSRLAVLSSLYEKGTATVLDAGRGEYYLRLPPVNGREAVESLESLSSLAEKVGGAKLTICEPQLGEVLGAFDLLLVQPPTAFDAIRLAQPRLRAQSFEDIAGLDANYVRRPYAEPATPTTGQKTSAP